MTLTKERVILDIVIEHPDNKGKLPTHTPLGTHNDPEWTAAWGAGTPRGEL